MSLLEQRIDFSGLTTTTKKLQTIKLLIYFKMFEVLEYYLRLTGYLRSYIHFYTKLSKPLHFLKTRFLKSAPVSSQ